MIKQMTQQKKTERKKTLTQCKRSVVNMPST